MTYEFHSFDDPSLPFIYHIDSLPVGPRCWGNWHENIEMLYFLEGEARVVCGGESYDMVPGRLLVVNSDCIHEIHPRVAARAACLIVGREFCRQNGIDTSALTFDACLEGGEAGSRFQTIMAEFGTKDRFAVAAERLAVLDMLVWLARYHSRKKAPPADCRGGREKLDTLKSVVNYLHAQMPGKVSADDAARACGISKYYLMHEFRTTFGCTMTSYVNQMRCEYAKPLLSAGTLPIQECGYLSGFGDPSYFSRVFRRCTGRTPAEYRREHAVRS